jgi:hypothetical protein
MLDWFSVQVYANLIKHDAQYQLVQLHKQIESAKLEITCSGFHHDHGAGAPPTGRSAAFAPEHFILSADDRSLTCPNGVTTFVGARSRSGEGRF